MNWIKILSQDFANMTSTCIVYTGSMPVRRSLNKGATRIYLINLTLLFDKSVLFIYFFIFIILFIFIIMILVASFTPSWFIDNFILPKYKFTIRKDFYVIKYFITIFYEKENRQTIIGNNSAWRPTTSQKKKRTHGDVSTNN